MIQEERRKLIDDIVTAYKIASPGEYAGVVEEIKKTRGSRANVWAADGQKELRLILKLPAELGKALKLALYEPGFLHEDAEARWFMKKYPEFKIPEKI